MDRRIHLLAGNERPGRCRDCHQRVYWRLSAPAGKWLPFDDHPLVLSHHENAETTVHFEAVSPETLHFRTCAARPPKARKGGVAQTGPMDWLWR